MEKKVIIKIAKIIIGINLLILLLGLIVFQVWLNISLSDFSVLSLIYWIMFVGWIGIIIKFKWTSVITLTIAFTFYIVGAILVTFGFSGLAEGVLRISVIGWILGIVQALLEYRKEHG